VGEILIEGVTVGARLTLGIDVVGEDDGLTVGNLEGEEVGALLGVGPLDGDTVGAKEGVTVGE